MSNVVTIARRELKAYFSSPLAYIITALICSLHRAGIYLVGAPNAGSEHGRKF